MREYGTRNGRCGTLYQTATYPQLPPCRPYLRRRRRQGSRTLPLRSPHRRGPRPSKVGLEIMYITKTGLLYWSSPVCFRELIRSYIDSLGIVIYSSSDICCTIISNSLVPYSSTVLAPIPLAARNSSNVVGFSVAKDTNALFCNIQ